MDIKALICQKVNARNALFFNVSMMFTISSVNRSAASFPAYLSAFHFQFIILPCLGKASAKEDSTDARHYHQQEVDYFINHASSFSAAHLMPLSTKKTIGKQQPLPHSLYSEASV